jgi:TonB family protein
MTIRAVELAGTAAAVVVIALVRPAAGQTAEPNKPAAEPEKPATAPPSGVSEPNPTADLVPPTLATHVEAEYPKDALAQRLEASVGLELSIDATGHVTGAKISSPAGHGFDEAAVAAARQFTFTPAHRGSEAIASTIQFTYEFHLPPPPPVPVPPPPKETKPREITQTGADQSTLVLATRPISAASSFTVRDRDFALRPIATVQDILRVTPGLTVVQHSGGGKATQYFLRGFDADHGTDLALSIDGVPINMVSHAHGQGFADTNFIIPEAVQRVEITKGPYFTNQGDFATAGAVNMVTRDGFEHSSVGIGFGGSPGHGEPFYRGLLIASPRFDKTKATFAVEVGRQNGPFENPDRFDRYKLWNKLTFEPSKKSTLSVGVMSYSANWHGSGQLPERAVDQGLVTRFGSLDPSEGGTTSRHQIYAQYKARPTEKSEIAMLGYLGAYRFNLYSNFTQFLNDPVNGDQIEQLDRRTFYGGRLSYRIVHELAGIRFDTTIGGDARNDDIHGELWRTVQRSQLGQTRGNDVRESFVGAFVNEEVSPAEWVRFDLGARADYVSFAVDDTLRNGDPEAPRSGVGAAQQLSPKASLVLSPLREAPAAVDVYVNYGHGFHSNDVRGVFVTPQVTPLARAIGEEVGSRARFFDRWDVAAALWQLDLDSETVWIGDEGTTEAAGSTRRQGVEFETRYEFTKWLAADLDVTLTKSAFTVDPSGNGLALAPKQTWAGGVSMRHDLGPGVIRSGLRFYGIGDRPASDDGFLVARGFNQFDLHLGYRHRRFDVALDVENLLNGTFRSAQFATTSRLRGEPAIGAPVPAGFSCGRGRLAAGPAPGVFAGCEDVAYTPAYPLTARVMVTVFLD